MNKKVVLSVIVALVIIATAVTMGILWGKNSQASYQMAETHTAETATAQSDLEAWAGVCQYIQVTYHGASESNAEGSLWFFWWKDGELIQNLSLEPEDAVISVGSTLAQNALCVIEEERSLETCSYDSPNSAIYRVTYDLTVYLIDQYNLELLRETFYAGESPSCPIVVPRGTIETRYGSPSADLDEILNWARQYWSP